jgi:rhodanese-related sulfurtransferase
MPRAWCRWRSIVLGVAVLLGPAAAGADHGVFAPVLTVDAESLKRLLDDGVPVVPVDLRPVEAYRKSRLPRARSVPLTELRQRVADIPTTGVLVLYCACPPAEINGAYHFLQRQGYRSVFVLEDGLADWAARGYPLER